MKNISTTRLCAIAAALALAAPIAASAQEYCVAPPKNLPHNLKGSPRWFTADATDADSTETRSELADPRWGNAGRNRFASDGGQNYWRIAQKGDYLLVSIEVNGELDVASSSDYVYFGISTESSTLAQAVRVQLLTGSSSPDGPAPFVGPAVVTAVRSGGAWGPALPGPAPSWLTNAAAWAQQSRSGQWGVNFKVDLADLLGADVLAANPRLRLAFAVAAQDEGGADTALIEEAPFVGGTKVFYGDLDGDGTEGDENFIPTDLSDWLLTTPIGVAEACSGIHLTKGNIGVPGDEVGGELSNWLRAGTLSSPQQIIAIPRQPNTDYDPDAEDASGCAMDVDCLSEYEAVSDGLVSAQYRLARWGAQSAFGTYEPLEDNADPAADTFFLDDAQFTLNCQDNTGSSVCGLDAAAEELELRTGGTTGTYTHQCMLVEMTATTPNVFFENASEYRNMDFEVASLVERVATIDVRGLQDFLGNTDEREVYLYVKRHNMPELGTAELPELPRAAMFEKRLQNNAGFVCADNVPCQGIPNEDDIPLGVCAPECDAEFDCTGGGTAITLPNETCICVPEEEAPTLCFAGDEGDQNGPDLPTEQELATVWPTVEIHAYYADGRTFTGADGVERKSLKSMTSFGMFVDHEDPYYGWTTDLSALDSNLEEVAPDVYRLTIPNEGSAEILVSVEAHEAAAEQELTDLYGVASTFGFWGTLSMVSTSAIEETTDLSDSTMVLHDLLDDDGRELMRNLDTDEVLTPLPGALPTVATFSNGSLNPGIIVEVVELPFLGRIATLQAFNAWIDTPSGCGWFGGSSELGTSYTITDGTTDVTLGGEQTWNCAPFALISE